MNALNCLCRFWNKPLSWENLQCQHCFIGSPLVMSLCSPALTIQQHFKYISHPFSNAALRVFLERCTGEVCESMASTSMAGAASYCPSFRNTEKHTHTGTLTGISGSQWARASARDPCGCQTAPCCSNLEELHQEEWKECVKVCVAFVWVRERQRDRQRDKARERERERERDFYKDIKLI